MKLTGMNSVVIPGMELPWCCSGCPMSTSDNGYEYYCALLHEDCDDPTMKRNDTCPMYEQDN